MKMLMRNKLEEAASSASFDALLEEEEVREATKREAEAAARKRQDKKKGKKAAKSKPVAAEDAAAAEDAVAAEQEDAAAPRGSSGGEEARKDGPGAEGPRQQQEPPHEEEEDEEDGEEVWQEVREDEEDEGEEEQEEPRGVLREGGSLLLDTSSLQDLLQAGSGSTCPTNGVKQVEEEPDPPSQLDQQRGQRQRHKQQQQQQQQQRPTVAPIRPSAGKQPQGQQDQEQPQQPSTPSRPGSGHRHGPGPRALAAVQAAAAEASADAAAAPRRQTASASSDGDAEAASTPTIAGQQKQHKQQQQQQQHPQRQQQCPRQPPPPGLIPHDNDVHITFRGFLRPLDWRAPGQQHDPQTLRACARCHLRGHGDTACPLKGPCINCRMMGHLRASCARACRRCGFYPGPTAALYSSEAHTQDECPFPVCGYCGAVGHYADECLGAPQGAYSAAPPKPARRTIPGLDDEQQQQPARSSTARGAPERGGGGGAEAGVAAAAGHSQAAAAQHQRQRQHPHQQQHHQQQHEQQQVSPDVLANQLINLMYEKGGQMEALANKFLEPGEVERLQVAAQAAYREFVQFIGEGKVRNIQDLVTWAWRQHVRKAQDQDRQQQEAEGGADEERQREEGQHAEQRPLQGAWGKGAPVSKAGGQPGNKLPQQPRQEHAAAMFSADPSQPAAQQQKQEEAPPPEHQRHQQQHSGGPQAGQGRGGRGGRGAIGRGDGAAVGAPTVSFAAAQRGAAHAEETPGPRPVAAEAGHLQASAGLGADAAAGASIRDEGTGPSAAPAADPRGAAPFPPHLAEAAAAPPFAPPLAAPLVPPHAAARPDTHVAPPPHHHPQQPLVAPQPHPGGPPLAPRPPPQQHHLPPPQQQHHLGPHLEVPSAERIMDMLVVSDMAMMPESDPNKSGLRNYFAAHPALPPRQKLEVVMQAMGMPVEALDDRVRQQTMEVVARQQELYQQHMYMQQQHQQQQQQHQQQQQQYAPLVGGLAPLAGPPGAFAPHQQQPVPAPLLHHLAAGALAPAQHVQQQQQQQLVAPLAPPPLVSAAAPPHLPAAAAPPLRVPPGFAAPGPGRPLVAPQFGAAAAAAQGVAEAARGTESDDDNADLLDLMGIDDEVQQQQQQQEQQQAAQPPTDQQQWQWAQDHDQQLWGEPAPGAATSQPPAAPRGWGAAATAPAPAAADAGEFPSLGAAAAGAGMDEDAAMQRALRESLTAPPPPPPPSAGRPGFQQQQQQVAGGPDVATAGLANATGEYNCFLNVVIQCLWSCRGFRTRIQGGLPPGIGEQYPVVGALQDLFRDLEDAERDWAPGKHRRVVNPTRLREALHAQTHRGFKMREMNDAAELMESLYEEVGDAENHLRGRSGTSGKVAGTRGALVDAVFGSLISEAVVCDACGGKRTHVVAPHMEHTHTYSAAVLRIVGAEAAAAAGARAPLGRLLREVLAQDRKKCDKDEGGCDRWQVVQRYLISCPSAFALQLAWGMDEEAGDIKETLEMIGEHLDMEDVFDSSKMKRGGGGGGGGAPAPTTFRLASMVCYYGQHYMALVKDRRLAQWVLYDDASASLVGDWEAVTKKCAAGRIQPAMLFFTAYDPASVPEGGALGSSDGGAPAVAAAAAAPGGQAPGGVAGAAAGAAGGAAVWGAGGTSGAQVVAKAVAPASAPAPGSGGGAALSSGGSGALSTGGSGSWGPAPGGVPRAQSATTRVGSVSAAGPTAGGAASGRMQVLGSVRGPKGPASQGSKPPATSSWDH